MVINNDDICLSVRVWVIFGGVTKRPKSVILSINKGCCVINRGLVIFSTSFFIILLGLFKLFDGAFKIKSPTFLISRSKLF